MLQTRWMNGTLFEWWEFYAWLPTPSDYPIVPTWKCKRRNLSRYSASSTRADVAETTHSKTRSNPARFALPPAIPNPITQTQDSSWNCRKSSSCFRCGFREDEACLCLQSSLITYFSLQTPQCRWTNRDQYPLELAEANLFFYGFWNCVTTRKHKTLVQKRRFTAPTLWILCDGVGIQLRCAVGLNGKSLE